MIIVSWLVSSSLGILDVAPAFTDEEKHTNDDDSQENHRQRVR